MLDASTEPTGTRPGPRPAGHLILEAIAEPANGRIRLTVHNRSGEALARVRLHATLLDQERTSPIASAVLAGDSIVYRPLFPDLSRFRGLYPVVARMDGEHSREQAGFSEVRAVLLSLGTPVHPALSVTIEPAEINGSTEVIIRADGIPATVRDLSVRAVVPEGVTVSPERSRLGRAGTVNLQISGQAMPGTLAGDGRTCLPVIVEGDWVADSSGAGVDEHLAGIAWIRLRGQGSSVPGRRAGPIFVALVLALAGGLIVAGHRLGTHPDAGTAEAEKA
jgi:plasmid stability protein